MANFLQIGAGAAIGYLTGGPAGAVAGGAQAAMGGGMTSALGNVGNGALTAGENLYLAATERQQLRQMAFQYALQEQSNAFDNMTSEKSEIMRESNVLRNVAMEQRKADNEITKEFIKSIV